MCGRYHLTLKALTDIDEKIARYEKWKREGESRDIEFQSYHIAPSEIAPVIIKDKEEEIILEDMEWQLYPGWKDFKPKWTFNARKDALLTSKMWKLFFPFKRCVIPVTGFYEFTGPKGNRIPHYLFPPDGEYLLAAGIYSPYSKFEGLKSFSMITTDPNDFVRNIPHHRMPCFLFGDEVNDWLTEGHSIKYYLDLLQSGPEDLLQEHIVSKDVNSTYNKVDAPYLIEKATLF